MKQTQLAKGIYLIDTHLGNENGLAAAYMLVSHQDVAFFDTGAAYSVPYFLEALKKEGLSPDNVKYIFVSHVHLDHFSGASHLLKYCSRAQVIVHARGLRHCQDPDVLIKAAAQVYGGLDILAQAFGIPEQIAEDRLCVANYELPFILGEKRLYLKDTPGHAMHHYALFDESERLILTGDAFGLSYPCHQIKGACFLVPTTSPSQFDPEQMIHTIDQLLALKPLKIAVAHFGLIDLTQTGMMAILSLKAMIYQFASLAFYHHTDIDRLEAGLWNIVLNAFKQQGGNLPEWQTRQRFSLDMRLNAQGLKDYYSRTCKMPLIK